MPQKEEEGKWSGEGGQKRARRKGEGVVVDERKEKQNKKPGSAAKDYGEKINAVSIGLLKDPPQKKKPKDPRTPRSSTNFWVIADKISSN